MLKYYSKLLLRFMIISWQRIRAFNFEFLMMFVQLIFNLSFILIFWGALLRHIDAFGDWTFGQLALYSGITFLGDSIGGVFFGFRDLPQKIVGGGLDKYMARPINTLFSILFEQVSIVYFLEQFIASLILITIVITRYSLAVSPFNMILGFLVLFIGVIIYNMVYGAITFLAFWVGKLGVFRNIIFGLSQSKRYPLSIFPDGIRYLLTFFVPIAFISYYPTVIFLGKFKIDLAFITQITLLLIGVSFIFSYVWNKGLKRYEANGG